MGCRITSAMGLNHPKCSGGSGFGERAVRVLVALEVRDEDWAGRRSQALKSSGGRRALGSGVEYMEVNLGRGF